MWYYGAFYRSALSMLLASINSHLVRWVRKKYQRLRALRKGPGQPGNASSRNSSRNSALRRPLGLGQASSDDQGWQERSDGRL